MPDVTPDMLANYFAAREEQRQQEIRDALPQLEEQVRTFLTAHAADSSLPQFLARLIRETAVAAYIRGGMHGRVEPPADSVMLFEALETIRSMGDLYPAWRAFDGRDEEENDD